MLGKPKFEEDVKFLSFPSVRVVTWRSPLRNPAGIIPNTPKAPGKLFHGGISLYIHGLIHQMVHKPDDDAIRLRRVVDRAVTGLEKHFGHIIPSTYRENSFLLSYHHDRFPTRYTGGGPLTAALVPSTHHTSLAATSPIGSSSSEMNTTSSSGSESIRGFRCALDLTTVPPFS